VDCGAQISFQVVCLASVKVEPYMLDPLKYSWWCLRFFLVGFVFSSPGPYCLRFNAFVILFMFFSASFLF
jgi:hypothetical protein